MTAAVDREVVRRAVVDIAFFARKLVGQELWPHQLAVALSSARIRCVCSGRRAGKSRTLALLALHEAFSSTGARVLILSAGEDAARELLAEISALASSAPLLAGAVVDDTKSTVMLANGSRIKSIPASQKQARGQDASLLILDEAAFVEEEIWAASKYTVLARPASRIVMASTPWGRRDRFFSVAWRAGMGPAPVAGYESWTWPSTVSPLVDRDLLELWRATSTDREYRTEVLAEWVDEAGAFFSSADVEDNVAPFELLDPGTAERRGRLAGQGRVVGGIDWGVQVDAHALAVVAPLADAGRNVDRRGADAVLFVPWVEAHHGMAYHRWIDRLVDVSDPARGGFDVRYLVSETNGVGAAPTEALRLQAWERRLRTHVVPVHTDARRKETAFGAIKLLLQRGRLVLPRHPELLRQLAALEFEQTESGRTRIAVPERAGHDDIAMGLAQAISAVRTSSANHWWHPGEQGEGDLLETASGTLIHERPRCWDYLWAFQSPAGEEQGDGW